MNFEVLESRFLLKEDLQNQEYVDLEKQFSSIAPCAWSRKAEYPFSIIQTKDLINKDSVVLDAGGGTRQLQAYLSKLVGKLVVADLDPAINNLKSDIVEPRVCNITQLPYADNTFDITYCISTLEHIPGNTVEHLNELIRVTKPGGKILVTIDYNFVNNWMEFRIPEFDKFTKEVFGKVFIPDTTKVIMSRECNENYDLTVFGLCLRKI